MDAAIVRTSRGPTIAGTRINVYDIYYHLEGGLSYQEIAAILRLSVDQVQAAGAYIEEHKPEVEAVHRHIEARNARGNPPEIQAKLDVGRVRLQQRLQAIRQRKESEANGDRDNGRQRCRGILSDPIGA
jgi:uncharacterized protein (DUF433 family)